MKIQRCAICDQPTEKCEDDSFFVGEMGPLCEKCFDKLNGDTSQEWWN